MGWLAMSLGFVEDAAGFYAGSPASVVSLGLAELELGRVDRARQRAEAVLDSSDDAFDRVWAGVLLASADLRTPRARQAADRLREAWEEARAAFPAGSPSRAAVVETRIDVLLALGDSAGADAACAALEVDDAWARRMRAAAAEARGRMAEAEGLLAGLRDANPAVEAWDCLNLAWTHRLQGRGPEARRDLARARELFSRSPQPTSADRAWMLLDTASFESDPEAAREGLRLLEASGYTGGPLLAEARVILGDALAASGHPAEARAAYDQALALLDASVGRRHRQAGRALLGLGRLARSRPRVEEALAAFRASLGPGHPEIRQAEEELRVLGAR